MKFYDNLSPISSKFSLLYHLEISENIFMGY